MLGAVIFVISPVNGGERQPHFFFHLRRIEVLHDHTNRPHATGLADDDFAAGRCDEIRGGIRAVVHNRRDGFRVARLINVIGQLLAPHRCAAAGVNIQNDFAD